MKFTSFFLFCFVSLGFHAQTGGFTSFSAFNLPFSARSAALGNDFISSKDQDLNLGIQNPSLYNAKMNRHLGFSQALLASGINYGMLSYAKSFDDAITGSASFRYVTYGMMDKTDEAGTSLGKFYAGDFILGSGIAKQLNPRISVGANLNFIYSQYESYNALGASLDMGACFEIPEKNFLVTALVKNAGYQFKSFTKGNRVPFPTELQFAIAYKVKHAPFRFNLLFHHMNQFDLTYNDPNLKPTIDPLSGDTIPVPVAGFGEKVFRHLTYQVELIITKNFHLRTAFDYHRRQELKLVQKPGIAGFSFGFGMYFKRFSLDYGLLAFSAAGYSNLLTLTTSLDKWKK